MRLLVVDSAASLEKTNRGRVFPECTVKRFDGANDRKDQRNDSQGEKKWDSDDEESQESEYQRINKLGNHPVADHFSVLVQLGIFLFFQLPNDNWRDNSRHGDDPMSKL